jgi:hypothetical protein
MFQTVWPGQDSQNKRQNRRLKQKIFNSKSESLESEKMESSSFLVLFAYNTVEWWRKLHVQFFPGFTVSG